MTHPDLPFRRVMPGIGSDSGDSLTAIRKAIRDFHGQHRVNIGLPALLGDPSLDRVASLRAEDMAAKGYFAHSTPDSDPGRYHQIMSRMGLWWAMAGENLYGVDARLDTVNLAQWAFAAWLKSPTHRANVEYPGYRHIGLGVRWRPDIQWNYVVAVYAEGLR